MSASVNQDTITAGQVRANLLEFLARQTKQPVADDLDLFGSGLVNSMFAMELVVHIESAFGVTIAGPDLRIANFRTVVAMTELVGRLREDGDG